MSIVVENEKENSHLKLLEFLFIQGPNFAGVDLWGNEHGHHLAHKVEV